jgi:thioredoxin family protein
MSTPGSEALRQFTILRGDGTGEVRQPRMYQLVRQKGPIKDVTFEIEFLDPGVEAFSSTFG